MKACLFAFSRQGIITAGKIRTFLTEDPVRIFVPERLSEDGFLPLPNPSEPVFREAFFTADVLVFVSACGIAVRKIAPFVHSKTSDPAVLCVDELGKFVIPLLSGHIGGANALAEKLAKTLGAVPVITTATDINHRFSADAWAVRNGFLIDSMTRAKEVSAAILERDIPMISQLPVISALPDGIISGDSGPIGIFLGWEIREPFEKTLRLIPQILHLGIGCKRGTAPGIIQQMLEELLTEQKIDRRALKCAASIDLKSGEPGLLEFCEEAHLPLHFYSAEELRNVSGNFSHSDFVEQVTGVGNICERAAMIGADRLLVQKTARNGVTMAVSAEWKGVSFE